MTRKKPRLSKKTKLHLSQMDAAVIFRADGSDVEMVLPDEPGNAIVAPNVYNAVLAALFFKLSDPHDTDEVIKHLNAGGREIARLRAILLLIRQHYEARSELHTVENPYDEWVYDIVTKELPR